jgi:AcrR family transcriptional regulator
MSETKQKILDTAVRLIAEQGYAATSLRHIIADARVNLAAIHYHFGTKEELLDEIIRRMADPVNAERMARLDRIEREAGAARPTVEEVLEAFLLPMAEAADRNPSFVTFMGRLMAEGLLPSVIRQHFQGAVTRLVGVMRRAVPDLPEEEFAWRMLFMSGTMAHTMCGTPHFANLGVTEGDFRSRIGRLTTFLSAGFRAPATVEARSEDK